MNTHRPTLWSPGDWNAFFGFGTNILVNMLTLTALLRYVLKLPDELVFGRILPATGMMLCLSTVYYAWLAYRLAKQTGRDDVSQSVMTYTLTPPITQADMTRDPLTTASSFSLRSLRRGDPNRHSSGAEPIRSATSRATRDA